MSEVWLTSDSHFGHRNILKYHRHEFLSEQEQENIMLDVDFEVSRRSADLMDNTIIDNINSMVGPNDTLWHLGDFTYKSEASLKSYRNRIRCNNINFIMGNHDNREEILDSGCFNEVYDLHEACFPGGIRIVLCHYAMKIWPKSHRGALHLFGHSHGSLDEDPFSKSMDVGLDTNNYLPYNLTTVLELLKQKEWVPVDHHGDRSRNRKRI